MSKLVIRPGRIDDADNIHIGVRGIAKAIGKPNIVRSTPDDVRRDGFGERPAFETLIAEIDSEFAGVCLHYPIYSTWMGRSGAYVQDLFVVERFRGMDVGEELLRRLAREVRDRGGAYVALEVDAGNLKAQRFYQRIGMKRDDDYIYNFMDEALLAFAEPDNSQETA